MRKKIRKVINRTGKFPCEICKEKQILCEHHINGRDIPNYSKEWNLCHICSNCHRLVHEGIIVIEGWIITSDGKKLFHHQKDQPAFSGSNSETYIIPKPS